MKGTILFKVSSFLIAVFVALVLLLVPDDVAGHGMILDPPGRSSMWRFGYDVLPNYSDNSLYCGGSQVCNQLNFKRFNTESLLLNTFDVKVQWNEVNQGRCGECGDEWSIQRPRQNDEGGKYGKGIIGKNYTQGDVSFNC